MPTVKLYSCKECSKTMIVEVFADESTTSAIMKQNPYCSDCTALHEKYSLPLTWNDMLVEFKIRECTVCTSMIASDGRYGRKPNKADASVCECCVVKN